MSYKTILISLLLLSVSATPLASDPATSDLAKEQRWADQIIEALLDGEAITLNDGKNDFLGILTESEKDKPSGAIVLHGLGVHPDWAQVVHPLRVGLPEHGWTTLSLQLPILANEAEFKDYIPLIPDAAPRIRAGIKHLRSLGISRVVIIAHSLGTVMTAHALANDDMGVAGFAAVGMPEDSGQYLREIKVPTLDLYGENDLERIVASAEQRKAAAAHNKQYSQVMGKGADHFFNDRDEQLLATIVAWLNRR